MINPSEPIPAYFQVDEITVDPQTGLGTTQQKFEEVWVFLNDNLIGTYSVPGKFPLLAEGENELAFFPGIRVNGIQSAADLYPFFEPHTIQVEFVPGTTTVVDMHTRYRSNVVIPWIEDFEGAHMLTDDVDDDPNTSVERITAGVFEGLGSGRIVLTEDADFLEVASLPYLPDLPVNGTPVFLEITYKNTVDFSIGLVGHASGFEPAMVTLLILVAQENWNRVYVELDPALQASQLDAYQILITAAYDSTQTVSEVLLDNLKVVHIAQ